MFKFGKNKEDNATTKQSWFTRLKSGLSKTQSKLGGSLASLVLGKKTIDANLIEELETILITADIGVATTQHLLDELTQKVSRKELTDPEVLIEQLKQNMVNLLTPYAIPLELSEKPFVLLMVGVNGAGKTTSTAKIAHYYKEQGYSIQLAAGDTFRAAAIEQLQVWGERNQVPVIAQKPGSDSAAVIYDAVHSTNAKQLDLLIADTAGRLHTQSNLMSELAKVKRVISKQIEAAPQETLLVIDAGNGQNALNQAREFNDAIGVTGICLTKLDGTAKGGIIFTLAHELKLPIRFVGVGEQIDDLKPFSATDFVDALFTDKETVLDD